MTPQLEMCGQIASADVLVHEAKLFPLWFSACLKEVQEVRVEPLGRAVCPLRGSPAGSGPRGPPERGFFSDSRLTSPLFMESRRSSQSSWLPVICGSRALKAAHVGEQRQLKLAGDSPVSGGRLPSGGQTLPGPPWTPAWSFQPFHRILLGTCL